MTFGRRAVLLGTGALAVAGVMPPSRGVAAAPGRAVTLSVRATGRTGQPAQHAFVELVRTDQPAGPIGFPVTDGTATVEVPCGEYLVYATVQDLPVRTFLAQPGVAVDRPCTLDLDARLGQPVEVAVPRADARPEGLAVHLRAAVRGGEPYDFYVWNRGDHTGRAFIGALDPQCAVAGFQVMVAVTFATADIAYFLAWQTYGRMPTGLRRTVSPHHLATVVQQFAGRAADSTGVVSVLPRMPGGEGADVGAGLPVALPSTRVDQYNIDSGGVAWTTIFDENLPDLPDQPAVVLSDRFTTYYQPRSAMVRWNQGVPGPQFPPAQLPEQWVTRNGDTVVVAVRMFSDSAGHTGTAAYRSARITLHRDGVLVGESDVADAVFTVPPQPGMYQLAVAVEPYVCHTRIHAVWTFGSAHVPGTGWRQLPLRAVTFEPPLRADGTAPAGTSCTVPYRMTTQQASVVRPQVSVSFDDGTTWAPAPVTDAAVVVRHPASARWVSLRATAPGMEQTIVRAYGIA
jgi:hypothetical protein